MTTGPEAIDRLAHEIAGATPELIANTARRLRDAGLWPRGRRGGGKSLPPVEPHHLVNLALGLLGAEAATRAPDVVAPLRALQPWIIGGATLRDLGLPTHPTLGEALDELVRAPERYALPVGDLIVSRRRGASVVFHGTEGRPVTVGYGPAGEPPPTTGLRVNAAIDGRVLRIMTQLARQESPCTPTSK